MVVPEDQLSLAIGRDGQNARLAAKLTAWRIDIKSLPEATADALYKIQTDPEFAELAEAEVEIVSQIEAILVKKDEGRPVTPEEYSILGQFVDRIERGIIAMHQAERAVELEQIAKVQEKIPAAAFEIPLEELGFTERVTNLLIEAGHESVGDLMVQMELDSDAILALNGIGPKAMEKIENTLAEVTFPEPEIVEEAPEVEVAEEAETEPTAEGAEEVVEAEPAEEAVEEGETLEEPAAAELEPEVEAAEIAPAVEVKEPVQEEDAEEPAAEEEEVSFEEMFALEPETFEKQFAESEFEDEGELEEEARKKKKEKKKKYVEMEYDPDQDVVIVKRKRKRDEEDWQEDWDY